MGKWVNKKRAHFSVSPFKNMYSYRHISIAYRAAVYDDDVCV